MKTNEELFKEWFLNQTHEEWFKSCSTLSISSHSFLAACEIKDKEIEELINKYETLDAHDEMLIKTVGKLKEQLEKAHILITEMSKSFLEIDKSNDDMKYYNSDINKILISINEKSEDYLKQLEQG